MQNKKTGPVTPAGKDASSKNALKHGGTSPKLINEVEQERYKSLLASLVKKYPSDNPLIELQLIRIARINIQLERIQNTIDALFEKSRTHSNLEKNLMEYLDVSLEQRTESILQRNGISSSSDATENKINREIIANKLSAPKSQQEFLETSPMFCAQLYKSACLENQTVEEYIDNLARIHDNQTGTPSQIRIIYVDPSDVKKDIVSKNKTIEESILETSLSSLKKAVNLKFTEIRKRESDIKKLPSGLRDKT